MVNEDEDPTNFLAMPQEIALALASRSNGSVKFWDTANNGPTQDISLATYQTSNEVNEVWREKRKRSEKPEQPRTMEVADLSIVSHN